ncbi:MAG: hypothetical protein JW844_04145 [Candidatus Omnitrophica bacterium]|nr:hypothetical protein [Candidatus Omnitrophota bacterium]
MKILITYASAGSGHRRAAEALNEACAELGCAGDVMLIDVLDYTNRFYRWVYPTAYLFMVRHLSLLWAFFFYALENKAIFRIANKVRRVINQHYSKRLRHLFTSLNPEYIVSTHFFPTEVATHLVKEGLLQSKLMTVITDFGAHNIWLSDKTHTYLVASELTKEELIRKGVVPEKVRVTGIPIRPLFGKEGDRGQIASSLGIAPDRMTVLVGGGGFGVGPIAQVVETVLTDFPHVQVLVVCGHDARLREKLLPLSGRHADRLRLFGFVDNMHELMTASDVIVTKAGGLTTSEALIKHLPMILLKPIPGQEANNARILTRRGAAVTCHTLKKVREALKKILGDEAVFYAMRESAGQLACRRAARTIIEYVLRGGNHEEGA